LIPHPLTGEDIDLQLCYSEASLDWIFKKYKGSADLLTMNLAVIKAEEEFARRAEEKFKEAMDLADKLVAEEAANGFPGGGDLDVMGTVEGDDDQEEEEDDEETKQLKAEAEALAAMNATAAANLKSALSEGSANLQLLKRIKAAAGKHVTLVLRILGVAKKGEEPSVEAVLCCKLLRMILRDLIDVDYAAATAAAAVAGSTSASSPRSIHAAGQKSRSFVSLFGGTDTLSNATLQPFIQPIFSALDRRAMDALSWADLNEVLIAIGVGKCSDEAFRLVMLSIGKWYLNLPTQCE
jgi:hypothetical protein